MRIEDLKPGIILRGPSLPEPIAVKAVTVLGGSVLVEGKGLDSGKFLDPVLTSAQLALLESDGGSQPFDGDPIRSQTVMRVGFHPAAEIELRASATFYEDRMAALGNAFVGRFTFVVFHSRLSTA